MLLKSFADLLTNTYVLTFVSFEIASKDGQDGRDVKLQHTEQTEGGQGITEGTLEGVDNTEDEQGILKRHRAHIVLWVIDN